MTTQVIIGAGEVGTALAEVLPNAHLRDVESSGPTIADALHVCFPWNDDFVDSVRGYQTGYGAPLIVIHSTVPVGTCDVNGWTHSPVRGRHPHLVDGIRTFVKHVGGVGARDAAKIFEDVGITTRVHLRAADTEAGKLWELIQYGINILVEKEIFEWCAEHGVDYNVVYTEFARTYNEGYQRLGEDEVTRPVLRHVPGPIGGHCVTRNAALVDSPLAQVVSQG